MTGTARRGLCAAREAPPILHRLTLVRCGESLALDIAAAHLEALGCRSVSTSVRHPSGSPAGAVAGYLELHRGELPRREHGRVWPAVGPAVRCGIDWAGPVDLPIRDETGVQAACGIMQVHGRRSGAPERLYVDYASATAGVLAAQGVLAALLARRRGMDLQRVSTSVTQAALLAVSQYLAAATAPDDWAEPHLPGGPPFTSSDRVRFEIETLAAERWWQFWTSLGAGSSAVSRGWRPFQQRYSTATCPLPAELYQAAAARTFTSVSLAAADAGISIVTVRERAPGAVREHAAVAGQPPPWRITALGGPAPAALAPGPRKLGSLPLAGLVVVESTRRVQGPLAGHLLRMLGARVIRIEPPGGDPLRGVPPMAGTCSARFLALGRGKQVVELDLGTAHGRQALRQLVAGSDVFLHNWAPGKAEQWELTAERLCAVRPGLVYAWASGWGEALGPAPPLGTDFMVQAYSGLAAQVVPPGAAPSPSLMTLTDVLGGAICAQGVLAGLLLRANTGRGQRVDSSLLAAAGVLLRGTDRSRTGRAPGAATPNPAMPNLNVPVCTDLAALAADPRFALAVRRGTPTFARPPWEFG